MEAGGEADAEEGDGPERQHQEGGEEDHVQHAGGALLGVDQPLLAEAEAEQAGEPLPGAVAPVLAAEREQGTQPGDRGVAEEPEPDHEQGGREERVHGGER